MNRPATPQFLIVCCVILLGLVLASGLGCHYPSDWLLENVLVLAAVGYLAATCRPVPLSRLSYGLILLFFGLHEIGAHWTFAEVPYDNAWAALFGFSLNEAMGWERNHYDRLVHFCYGFLLARPMRETLLQAIGAAGFWSYALPVIFITFTSEIYELIEWAAAIVFGGDLGQAYLGTQGDVWDAQRDTALALLGAIIATLIMAWNHRRTGRDAATDYVAGLGKHPAGRG